jgi:hypothetical protein
VSVPGYSHRKADAPCEDASVPSEAEPFPPSQAHPLTVLAVADGAGSRRHSAEGAWLAIRLARDFFGPRLLAEYPALAEGSPHLEMAVQPARAALHAAFAALVRTFTDEVARLAAQARAELSDYATTLTVVTLAPGLLLYATLGDGFVLVRAGTEGDEPQIHLLPRPESMGEYVTDTVFLTSEDAERRIQTYCLVDPGITGVLLSTDGLAQAMLTDAEGRFGQPNTELANRLLELLDTGDTETQEDVRGLLLSDRLAQTSGDDMTVVRAVRAEWP